MTTVLVDDEFLLFDFALFGVVGLFLLVTPRIGVFFTFGGRQVEVASLKRRVLNQLLFDPVFQRSLSHLQDFH